MITNPGALDKKVDIWKGAPATRQGFDAMKPVKLYSRISAAIQPARGSQFYEAQLTSNKATTKVVIRYRKDITEACTVTYRDRVFDIVSVVDPNMQHESLELYCSETLRGSTPTKTPDQRAKDGGWEP